MIPRPSKVTNPFVGWVSQLPVVGVSSKRKVSQMSEQVYPFYFAVPRSASRVSRERVPSHLAREFGVVGAIEHVRSEESFHLYRVVSA